MSGAVSRRSLAQLAAVVLAAGSSSRLHRPKQLLTLRGETLVHRAARLGLEAGANPVLVVVGAHGDAVARAVADLDVQLVHNPSWRRGMGTSLAVAVAALPADVVAAMCLLTDQIGVTTAHLSALIQRHRRQRADATFSRYDEPGTRGPPVILDRKLFLQVVGLRGDRGARAVVRPQHRVSEVWLAGGDLDIDRPQDIPRHLQ